MTDDTLTLSDGTSTEVCPFCGEPRPVPPPEIHCYAQAQAEPDDTPSAGALNAAREYIIGVYPSENEPFDEDDVQELAAIIDRLAVKPAVHPLLDEVCQLRTDNLEVNILRTRLAAATLNERRERNAFTLMQASLKVLREKLAAAEREVEELKAEMDNPLGQFQEYRRLAVHWEEVSKGLERERDEALERERGLREIEVAARAFVNSDEDGQERFNELRAALAGTEEQSDGEG